MCIQIFIHFGKWKLFMVDLTYCKHCKKKKLQPTAGFKSDLRGGGPWACSFVNLRQHRQRKGPIAALCQSQSHGWRLFWSIPWPLSYVTCACPEGPQCACVCVCLCEAGRLFFDRRIGAGSERCKWMASRWPCSYNSTWLSPGCLTCHL